MIAVGQGPAPAPAGLGAAEALLLEQAAESPERSKWLLEHASEA